MTPNHLPAKWESTFAGLALVAVMLAVIFGTELPV